MWSSSREATSCSSWVFSARSVSESMNQPVSRSMASPMFLLPWLVTIEEVTSILYMVEVDLLTANSDFGGAPVEEWTVRPPAILLTTEPGEADRAVLSGPESIWSGAPTTLAASVIDEAGMIVDGPVTFAFYGPGGELLETIESERGSATYQTQPVSVAPTLTAARLSMITFESGLEVEGLVLEGTGLSGYATVKVGGRDIAERGYELAWVDSRTLVATPTGDEPEPLEGGTVTIEIVSPGGASTGTASFDL